MLLHGSAENVVEVTTYDEDLLIDVETNLETVETFSDPVNQNPSKTMITAPDSMVFSVDS